MVTSTPRARAASTSLSVSTLIAPIGLADHLVMRDLRGQPALFADADGLAHAVEHVRRFVAHVRDVDAAHAPHHLGDLDDFLGGREVAWHIEQSGGEAERAVAHGLRGQRLHLFDLFGRGLAVGQADHFLADASLPHHGGEVDRDGRFGDAVEEWREGQRRAAVRPFHDRGDAFAQIILRGGHFERCRGGRGNGCR